MQTIHLDGQILNTFDTMLFLIKGTSVGKQELEERQQGFIRSDGARDVIIQVSDAEKNRFERQLQKSGLNYEPLDDLGGRTIETERPVVIIESVNGLSWYRGGYDPSTARDSGMYVTTGNVSLITGAEGDRYAVRGDWTVIRADGDWTIEGRTIKANDVLTQKQLDKVYTADRAKNTLVVYNDAQGRITIPDRYEDPRYNNSAGSNTSKPLRGVQMDTTNPMEVSSGRTKRTMLLITGGACLIAGVIIGIILYHAFKD